jgi:hypothetical protein
VRCAACKKGGCKPWERNTDGTYTHSACLYAESLVVVGRHPNGKPIFAQKSAAESAAGSEASDEQ